MTFKIAALCFFLSLNLYAAEWTFIKTDRGTELEIKIVSSSKVHAPLIVIAPGQSCNSKGALFETIEKEAITFGLNVVRFEWSYCSPNAPIKNPSDDLSAEVSDLNFAVANALEKLSLKRSDVRLAGKSLGSIVAYELFRTGQELQSLTLLTPVCSYNSANVINENYPSLEKETRPVLLISGDQDPLCSHPHLKELESRASKNISIIYAKGDHGFGITRADGSQDPEEKQNNLTKVSLQMIEWLKAL